MNKYQFFLIVFIAIWGIVSYTGTEQAKTKQAKTKQVEKRAPIMCYVARENDTDLACIDCEVIDETYTHVVTTTFIGLKVHSSRVRWAKDKNHYLLKPYMGTKDDK